jgi:HPt (histidine-containing phosphotransfer) domain-containing protein
MEISVPQNLLLKYKLSRKDDYETCLESFVKNDLSHIERVGHRMKGSGETFGYPEISEIGKRLEVAASKKDRPIVQLALSDFKTWIEVHT